MIRSLLALLAFAPLAYSAPLPKFREAPLYFPIQVGAKRVLELSSGAVGTANRETIETVTKVEQKEGKYLVTFSLERPGLNAAASLTSTFAVSEKGISRVRTQDRELAQPVIVLQLPGKEGNTWELNGMTYKVGKEEEIEVPAGKFKAVSVTMEQERGAVKQKTTSWYAPKVGLIKTVMILNGTERITVLKSFTPGK